MTAGPVWAPANPFKPKKIQCFLLPWEGFIKDDPYCPHDFAPVDAFLNANPDYVIIGICLEPTLSGANQPRLHVIVQGPA
jgi:hypothetical protein